MICLVAKDLLNPDALHSGIQWEEQSEDVRILVRILQVFRGG